ncbi:MAG: hypothetical protein L0Z62_42605 [Gemmataceae bacterium]|nr:hypothetical protein [Gemmataceae bacterium]
MGVLLLYAVGVPGTQAIDSWAVAEGFDRALWFRGLAVLFVPTCFLGGFVLAIVLAIYLCRNRYRLAFQAEFATVWQLAEFLARADSAEREPVPWTGATIWFALRGVLAEATGRARRDVTRETDLIAGLGLSPPALPLA